MEESVRYDRRECPGVRFLNIAFRLFFIPAHNSLNLSLI